MGNPMKPADRAESKATIVSTPGICGGRPRIAGHRIQVQDVVLWRERLGMSVEEILSEYPSLVREEIECALDYYAGHRGEIQDLLKDEEDFDDNFQAVAENTISAIFSRDSDGKDDSVPPR